MDKRCSYRYYRVELDQIAYIRFIVESYEGIAQMTSFPRRAEIEWVIPDSMMAHVNVLARALAEEICLVPISKPEDWPPSADRTGRSRPRSS
jgi:hypothetical protein